MKYAVYFYRVPRVPRYPDAYRFGINKCELVFEIDARPDFSSILDEMAAEAMNAIARGIIDELVGDLDEPLESLDEDDSHFALYYFDEVRDSSLDGDTDEKRVRKDPWDCVPIALMTLKEVLGA